MATPNFAARRLTYHILALVLALAPVAARADGPAGVTELVLEVAVNDRSGGETLVALKDAEGRIYLEESA